MKKDKTKKVMMAAVVIAGILLCAGQALFAAQYGPGRVGLKIWAGRKHDEAGLGGIWNSRDKLHVQLDPADGWRIKKVHMYVGSEPIPTTQTGNPKIGHFPYKEEFPAPYMKDFDDGHVFRRTLVVDLEEDLGFKWGSKYEPMRIQNIAVHMDLVKLDTTGKVTEQSGAWVVPELVIFEEDPDADAEEVADEVTGEVVAEVEEDSEKDRRGDRRRVAKHEHKKAQKTGETEDIVDLEKKISTLLAKPEQCTEFAQAGRKRVDQMMGTEQMLDGFMSAIHHVHEKYSC